MEEGRMVVDVMRMDPIGAIEEVDGGIVVEAMRLGSVEEAEHMEVDKM